MTKICRCQAYDPFKKALSDAITPVVFDAMSRLPYSGSVVVRIEWGASKDDPYGDSVVVTTSIEE